MNTATRAIPGARARAPAATSIPTILGVSFRPRAKETSPPVAKSPVLSACWADIVSTVPA